MKDVLPIIVLFILFGDALSDKSVKNKIIDHTKKSLKHLQGLKTNQRKLEESTDVESTDTESGVPNGTLGNTTSPPVDVPVNQTVANTPKKSDNSGTALHIKNSIISLKRKEKLYTMYFSIS